MHRKKNLPTANFPNIKTKSFRLRKMRNFTRQLYNKISHVDNFAYLWLQLFHFRDDDEVLLPSQNAHEFDKKNRTALSFFFATETLR